MPAQDEIFGNVIYSYTRKQAIEDGFLVDLTDPSFTFRPGLNILKEAGIKFPVAMTTTAFARTVQDPDNDEPLPPCQDLSGRLAEIELSNIPGYFPTQAPVIEIMLRRARIESGMKVLEPEAGSGYIADAIRAAHPGAWVDTVEINSRLRDLLVLKNYRVMAFDFLEFENDQESPYDRIVMNPPFERQQDLDHIRHAYKLLAPGGILVSVLSPSFEFRSDRKSTEFRAWMHEVNAKWENLPDGAFKASGTGVSTRLLVIERN